MKKLLTYMLLAGLLVPAVIIAFEEGEGFTGADIEEIKNERVKQLEELEKQEERMEQQSEQEELSDDKKKAFRELRNKIDDARKVIEDVDTTKKRSLVEKDELGDKLVRLELVIEDHKKELDRLRSDLGVMQGKDPSKQPDVYRYIKHDTVEITKFLYSMGR